EPEVSVANEGGDGHRRGFAGDGLGGGLDDGDGGGGVGGGGGVFEPGGGRSWNGGEVGKWGGVAGPGVGWGGGGEGGADFGHHLGTGEVRIEEEGTGGFGTVGDGGEGGTGLHSVDVDVHAAGGDVGVGAPEAPLFFEFEDGELVFEHVVDGADAG